MTSGDGVRGRGASILGRIRSAKNAKREAASLGGTLIVGPTLKFGGKANFTRIILAALGEAGFDVELFEASRSARRKHFGERLGGKRLVQRTLRLMEVAASSVVQKVRFALVLLRGRYSTAQIHVSSGFDFYDLSVMVWIGRLMRRKIIVRCGGGDFDGFYRRSSRLGKWYVSTVLRSADRIIAQSDYWRTFISGLGVVRDHIHVIPNFVDVDYWNAPLESQSPSSAGVTFVYMPGGSEHRKGFHTFMPAFARVAARRPELRLRLIALGREVDDTYRDLIERGQIEVLGFVSGQRKRHAIASADVFALPTHAEGFPNALIEGMAAGLAVISSRIPQITAIVDDGVNGLLIDPADVDEIELAIETLCLQPDRRRQMGLNNVARCRERYDVSLIPEHFRRLYDMRESEVRCFEGRNGKVRHADLG